MSSVSSPQRASPHEPPQGQITSFCHGLATAGTTRSSGSFEAMICAQAINIGYEVFRTRTSTLTECLPISPSVSNARLDVLCTEADRPTELMHSCITAVTQDDLARAIFPSVWMGSSNRSRNPWQFTNHHASTFSSSVNSPLHFSTTLPMTARNRSAISPSSGALRYTETWWLCTSKP